MTAYIFVCDRCGYISDWFFDDIAAAQIHIEYNRWAMINNKLYCPDCYEIEDDGEIKAKPKKRKI
ncbi:MAG: hypothetical protein GX885_11480 [Methanomicrobiales archaeon]|nr:hypothetical protein [Methanomicrobiales archaeon]